LFIHCSPKLFVMDAKKIGAASASSHRLISRPRCQRLKGKSHAFANLGLCGAAYRRTIHYTRIVLQEAVWTLK
jgi:hypothetical protein